MEEGCIYVCMYASMLRCRVCVYECMHALSYMCVCVYACCSFIKCAVKLMSCKQGNLVRHSVARQFFVSWRA